MSNIIEIPKSELPPKGKNEISKISNRLHNFLFNAFGLKNKYPLDLSTMLEGNKVNVIDIGASISFHQRWNQLGNTLSIYLFEPDETEFKKLIGLYQNDNRVKLFNVALSEDGEDIFINVNTWVYSSSAFKHDQEFFSNLNMRNFYVPLTTVKVPSSRLADVVQEKIDFIKLDVEGFELSILRGSSDILDECVGIESEVSYIKWAKDLPLFSDLDSYLQAKGFRLSRIATPSNYHYILPTSKFESQGIPFSGDVLYFRDPFSVIEFVKSGKWDSSKIIKAIALYLVYGNVEFAYVLMEEAFKNSLIDEKSQRHLIKDLIEQRSGYHETRPQRKIALVLKKVFKVSNSKDSLDF